MNHDADTLINALFEEAHRMQVLHPDDIHKIHTLREKVEEASNRRNLSPEQNDQLAAIGHYAAKFHEQVHIQKQMNQLDSELLTDPEAQYPVYFAELTLRLKELASKGIKKGEEAQQALLAMRNIQPKRSK